MSPSILIVTTVSTTIEAFLLPYVRELKVRGWRVEGCASLLSEHRDLLSEFDAFHDVEFSRSPLSLINFRALKKVGALMETGRFDLVHVHTPVASWISRLAHIIRPWITTRLVYTAHGFHFHSQAGRLRNQVFTALERLVSWRTDSLIVINDEDRDSAVRLGLVHTGSVVQLPGVGLDLNYYSADRIERAEIDLIRSRLGLAPDDKLFTVVAEMNPGKRHRDAIGALAGIQDSKFHLAFAGSGPLEDDLRVQAERLGVSPRVHFLGHQSDVRPLLLASSAMVLPSEREGLPRCVMEALSLGVPVIGADARGTRDLLASGGGELVPIGDSHAMGVAMKRIAFEWDHAGQKEVLRNQVVGLSIENLVEEQMEIYYGLLPREARK